MTSEELGQDLEHVEVLQKKFEEFQTDMAAHEERVNEVNQFAAKLVQVSGDAPCLLRAPVCSRPGAFRSKAVATLRSSGAHVGGLSLEQGGGDAEPRFLTWAEAGRAGLV